MRVTRRGLLAGGTVGAAAAVAGAALVEYDVLPGRAPAHALLGLNGEAGVVPDVEAGPREEGTLPSAFVAEDPGFVIHYPPGTGPGAALPVVVALHGARSTASGWLEALHLGKFLAASGLPVAVAAADGGRTSYWHERSDGSDPARMVQEELLPLLADRGLRTDALGLLGWSMGGLGALMLGATLSGDGPPVPVLAVSPALWPSYDDSSPEAFDSEEQYDACLARAARGLALGARVDCGTGDPFYRDVRAVLEETGTEGRVEEHWEPGAHEVAYWTRVLPDQLAWLGARVSAARA